MVSTSEYTIRLAKMFRGHCEAFFEDEGVMELLENWVADTRPDLMAQLADPELHDDQELEVTEKMDRVQRSRLVDAIPLLLGAATEVMLNEARGI